ncbi:MAG TPA: SCO family protein [Caldilineaceae bacterium]|nr:SCO family protein [Caldilineaceae bacterium]
MKQLTLLAIALFTTLAISGTAPAGTYAAPLPAVERSMLQGTLYAQPRPAFGLALPSTTDGDVHLRDLQGKVVLLFFGYTYCPDVCPTTLADIKQAFAKPGVNADEIAVLFVTVDPARDTIVRLTEFLGYFHEPSFIGVRGNDAQTAAFAYQYGAKFYREEGATGTDGYSMAHTTHLYLINRQSEWVMTVPWGTSPEQLALDLRYWLAR